MNTWTLDTVISRFDHFLKGIDYAHLPARESEEYRQLVLQTANDVMFAEGRYSHVTEWTLELFDVPEVVALTHDLAEIDRLSKAQRQRLGFYLDLAEVCCPLFRGKKVDWTAWPWLMHDASDSMDNDELFDTLTRGERPFLEAAMLYDLKEQVWRGSNDLYTSVARQEVADAFNYDVKRPWEDRIDRKPDLPAVLASAVSECANKMWQVENHLQVGRLLGFDWLSQSVYDAFDTFIDTTYRHRQVVFARELAAWIGEHWPMGTPHPEQTLVDALDGKIRQLMQKHAVTSPDFGYTWNILMLDVLAASAFSEEDEEDDDPWDEEE